MYMSSSSDWYKKNIHIFSGDTLALEQRYCLKERGKKFWNSDVLPEQEWDL